MATSWHVMRSKPNREEFLARELESRDVEYYYPRLRANPVNPRARRFKPYFPGYLFIRVDLEKTNHSTLEHIPGAANLVSFGGEFSYVPENIVHAIQRKVDEVNEQGGERAAALHPGDHFRSMNAGAGNRRRKTKREQETIRSNPVGHPQAAVNDLSDETDDDEHKNVDIHKPSLV